MRFLICVFILTVLSFGASASRGGANDTINKRAGLKRHGYWEKKRLNGKVKWQGTYVKGKREGQWRVYAKTGHYSEGKLVNGKRKGQWYYVAPDGTKLDRTDWDGKGNCVGGATLSW